MRKEQNLAIFARVVKFRNPCKNEISQSCVKFHKTTVAGRMEQNQRKKTK